MKVAVAIVYCSEHGVSPEGYEIIDIHFTAKRARRIARSKRGRERGLPPDHAHELPAF